MSILNIDRGPIIVSILIKEPILLSIRALNHALPDVLLMYLLDVLLLHFYQQLIALIVLIFPTKLLHYW